MPTEIVKMCVEQVLSDDRKELQDMAKNSKNDGQFRKLKAAFMTKKLWPTTSVIKIAFVQDSSNITRTRLITVQESTDEHGNVLEMDPLQRKVDDLSIEDAVKLIVNERVQPITGVNLIFTDRVEEANIRISFDPTGGSWSLVGTDCLKELEEPTMNLGWFDVATTLHEFGHALGMIHEHQNPDGNKIQWDADAVYEWAENTQGWDKETTDVNILRKYDDDIINGSSFDPQSIMLYFFPGELTTNNRGTHQNLRLSGLDVEYLSKVYPNGVKSADIFYQTAYNESLQSSIRKSEGRMNPWYLGIVVVAAAFIAGAAIKFKIKNKNKFIDKMYYFNPEVRMGPAVYNRSGISEWYSTVTAEEWWRAFAIVCAFAFAIALLAYFMSNGGNKPATAELVDDDDESKED